MHDADLLFAPPAPAFPDLYSWFGLLGESIQTHHAAVWNETCDAVLAEHGAAGEKIIRTYVNMPPWIYWYSFTSTIYPPNRRHGDQAFRNFWHCFRLLFRPHFPDYDAVSSHQEELETVGKFYKVFNDVRARKHFVFEHSMLCKSCYGPFSVVEMSYLLAAHRSIVEVGAGTGYFAMEFKRRGGSIIGLDDGSYWVGDTLSAPHIAAAQEAGVLRHADAAEVGKFAKGRAMLISWPMPQSDFPVRALRAYVEGGGTTLLFKPGAFNGSRFTPHSDSHPTNANIGTCVEDPVRDFLEMLIQDWEQVPTPTFRPEVMANNLWCFRRR